MTTADKIDGNVSSDIKLELNSMDGGQNRNSLDAKDDPVVLPRSTVRDGIAPEEAVNLSSTDVLGFELRLVLEFCDCGNLRQALDLVRVKGRHNLSTTITLLNLR